MEKMKKTRKTKKTKKTFTFKEIICEIGAYVKKFQVIRKRPKRTDILKLQSIGNALSRILEKETDTNIQWERKEDGSIRIIRKSSEEDTSLPETPWWKADGYKPKNYRDILALLAEMEKRKKHLTEGDRTHLNKIYRQTKELADDTMKRWRQMKDEEEKRRQEELNLMRRLKDIRRVNALLEEWIQEESELPQRWTEWMSSLSLYLQWITGDRIIREEEELYDINGFFCLNAVIEIPPEDEKVLFRLQTSNRKDLERFRELSGLMKDLFEGKEELSDEMCRELRRTIKYLNKKGEMSEEKKRERAKEREKARKEEELKKK